MKKFLLSLLALFSFFSIAHSEEEIMKLTFPATGGENVGSYTATWNATVDGNTWVIDGFNSNKWQNGWTFIKCGRKNNAHTASITSPAVDDAVITKVVVAVQKTSNVTAVSLTVLNGATEVKTIDATESFAAGDVEIPIEDAVAGYSYKLTIESSSASANGTTVIDGVTLYGNPTVAPTVAKPVITPATGTYYSEQTVTITAEEGATIYYSLNDGEAAEYTEPFTVSETTTITAYAKKGEDVSGNVSATLTFATTYTTLAAANEAATKDKVAVRLTFTEALVTYVNGSNAYIQDGTGAMLIYGPTTLKAGDKISGNIDGELYTYNGLPEVASPTLNIEVVSSDNEVVPTAVSAADLAANPLKYVSQYVVISDAVFADDIAETAPGKANNFNFTVGETALILRNNFKVDLAATAGSLYKVAGFVTVYNTNVQLYPTASTDLTEIVVAETTNLDFSLTTPVEAGVRTYAKDLQAEGETSGAQPVEGWTITSNGDARAAGVYAYGSEPFLGGDGYYAPAVNPLGEATGNALGIVAVWSATTQYTQEIVLQAGNYKLSVPVYNSKGGTAEMAKNLIGFIASDGTEYLATAKTYPVDTWTEEEISFTLKNTTRGVLSLGYSMTNAGSGSAPHLFIDEVTIYVITEDELLHKELADALVEATAIVEAKANVGDELFQIPEAAFETFADVVAAQQLVSENDEATEEQLRDAIAALEDAVATYAAAVNAPDAEAEYALQLKDGGMYMSLDEGTKLSADPAPLKFVAVEGGYAITDGTYYVANTSENAWTMGVATEPYAWIVTLQDGYYHIAKAGNTAQHIGVDNTAAGSACYADKGVNDKSLWTIVPYVEVEPVDVTSLIKNPAYLENGYEGWTYTENGFKVREYEAPMNLITYSGNAAFEVSQTIENVPAGLYKLTVNAFYRAGSLDDEKAKIAAGTELEKELTVYAAVADDTYSRKVMNLSEGATDVAYGEGTTTLDNGKFVPNSAAESRAWYIAGEYTNEVLFNVFEDGSVTIGLSKNAGLPSDYCPIGAWKLYRLGDADPNKAQPDVVPVDPVQKAYENALAAVEDGGNYRIFTAVEGKKYYVTVDGLLTNVADDGGIFTITKVTGGSYKEYGYKIDSGTKRFTNPPLKDNVANLTTGVFATTTGNRNDWEAQVLFLNEEGLYAIRSCNVPDGTSSWNDAGRTYWTYVVEEAPTPQYTYELTYNWLLESVVPINVTYSLVESDGTTEVKSVTKKQVSYSAISVPSDLTSNVAYDYQVQGTIGEEDCTITVVRSFKAGVVHSLAELSNAKAYTIRCDRGAFLTKDGYLASTAHGSLTQAEAANFAVINYDAHYYLYSVDDNKFVTNSGALADEPVNGVEDAIIMEAQTDPYFFAYFTIDGTNCGLNTNGNDPYGYVINTWMTVDAGNQYYLIEAADFDATAALAILDAIFNPEYAITIATIENGTVEADKAKAKEGETVTLTITPAEGYILDTLTVTAGEESVTVTDNTFVMPAGDVTITATFILPDRISALAAEGKAEIFDLNGRRVSKVQRGGIYVINGKRVAVK